MAAERIPASDQTDVLFEQLQDLCEQHGFTILQSGTAMPKHLHCEGCARLLTVRDLLIQPFQ